MRPRRLLRLLLIAHAAASGALAGVARAPAGDDETHPRPWGEALPPEPPRVAQANSLWPYIYHTWQTFTTLEGLPHDNVAQPPSPLTGGSLSRASAVLGRAIRALHARGGRLWVGTDGGLACWDGGTWKSWTAADGLPWPAVSAIHQDDRTQEVWLGTWGGGLVRFSGGRFDRFNQFNSGLAGDLVFAVSVAEGRVWAATNGGLCSYDAKRDEWNLYAERRADAPETAVINVIAQNDRLYLASWCEALREFSPASERWIRMTPPARVWDGSPDPSLADSTNATAPIPVGDEVTLAIDTASGSPWWATQSRICRRDTAGRWQSRDLPMSSSDRVVARCLAAFSDTEAWIGTDDGLQVLATWSDDTWVSYRRAATGSTTMMTLVRGSQVLDTRAVDTLLPDQRIRCIAFLGGDVWIGTPAGLVRGTDRAARPPLPVAGRPGPPILNPAQPRIADTAGQTATASANAATGQAPTIAVFVPLTRMIALPGETLHAANLRHRPDLSAVQAAIEEANARGGYHGRFPYRLVTGLSGFGRYGWGAPEDDLIHFANQPDVGGIVASLGPRRRIAGAVLLQTEVPVVNAAASLPAVEESLNPWVFRCRSNDPRTHQLLADYVLDCLGARQLAVLRTPGQEPRLHLEWYIRQAQARGCPPVLVAEFDPQSDDAAPIVQAIGPTEATAVLTWCDAPTSAMILRQLRAAGIGAAFIGSDLMVCDEFVKQVGPEAGIVLALDPCKHRRLARSASSFKGRKPLTAPAAAGQSPFDLEASLGFDATLHLLDAIEQAGSDRLAVRRALEGMGLPSIVQLDHGQWTSVSRNPQSP